MSLLTPPLTSAKVPFRLVPDWPRLPEGMVLQDVSGVAVDSDDNVYLFTRGDDPVVVLDPAGSVVRTWGQGLFRRPHGATMLPDDTLWLADDGTHTLTRCTRDGEVLQRLGDSTASPFMSGRPFHRPTHAASSPDGALYVSDGYGNARVHKFDAEGRHLLSWGEPGIDPGQFNVVHNLACDAEGRVYVADRENFRVQVFDPDGRFLTMWHGLYRPQALLYVAGPEPTLLVGENGPATPVATSTPNLGACVTALSLTGERLWRVGGPRPGIGALEFLAPHGLALDSRGSLYVGEVSWNTWPKKFPDAPRPEHLRTVRKLAPLAA